MQKRTATYVVLGVLVLAGGGLLASRSFSASETSVSALAGDTHFHGIAVDARDANRVYLATHHGLFAVASNGTARRISETRDDFMGFTPHPTDASVLYASGHPAGGGNLGFIASSDGGASWSKLSNGVGGPVDFHQMDVSKANPKVIYGVYRDLQKSTDGGRTWTRVGPAPEGVIGIAASSRDVNRLYAATQRGLLVSTDGGRQWWPVYKAGQPATMVHITGDGAIYAFVTGSGLIRTNEPDLDWEVLSNGFGSSAVLHFAATPAEDKPAYYAVTFNPETRSQAVHVSRDRGRSWGPLGAE